MFRWLPDSRRLALWKSVAGKSTGPVISLTGEPPVQLDEAIPEDSRIHPDGRRIAYSGGARTLAVWALENFLPSANRRTN